MQTPPASCSHRAPARRAHRRDRGERRLPSVRRDSADGASGGGGATEDLTVKIGLRGLLWVDLAHPEVFIGVDGVDIVRPPDRSQPLGGLIPVAAERVETEAAPVLARRCLALRVGRSHAVSFAAMLRMICAERAPAFQAWQAAGDQAARMPSSPPAPIALITWWAVSPRQWARTTGIARAAPLLVTHLPPSAVVTARPRSAPTDRVPIDAAGRSPSAFPGKAPVRPRRQARCTRMRQHERLRQPRPSGPPPTASEHASHQLGVLLGRVSTLQRFRSTGPEGTSPHFSPTPLDGGSRILTRQCPLVAGCAI